jgi:DNA-binding transcriptional LysR family regulator
VLILKNIGFDRLKVFYYVFSKKSVIAASKSLNISQSAVSQSIQKLESELNVHLFTRLHKQLIPTTAGERLFTVVKPFMEELDICIKKFKTAKDQPFGELRIGAPVEFGKAYLPAIVAAFRTKYPDVTFHLKVGDPSILLPLLKKGEIDFAIVDLFQTQSHHSNSLDIYNFQTVAEEEIILACSMKYYEEYINKNHSFENLARQNFITYKGNIWSKTINIWFKHHFGKTNFPIESVLIINSHQAILSAIELDVGMGIIASHLARKEIRKGQIIGIKTSKPDIVNQMALTQLQDKVPTLTEKVFIEFLTKKIESIGL